MAGKISRARVPGAIAVAVGSLEELFAALARRTAGFQALVGTAESDQLEFKGQPYGIDQLRHKLELAKDLSALANAGGGVIVLGARTEKDPLSEFDVVTSISEIPRDLVPLGTIKQLALDYIYPPLAIECTWWEGDDAARGLASLRVERQDESDKLFVVVQGQDADGEPVRNSIGVFQRQGATVHAVRPALLYEHMRAGRQVRRGTAPAGGVEPVLPSSVVAGRRRTVPLASGPEQVEADVQASAIPDAMLVLQAYPKPETEVRWLIAGTMERARSLVDTPPSLRRNGFNLDFAGDVESLPGGGLRKVLAESASLSVLPSGLTTLCVGYRYLGWAMDKPGRPPGLINGLALVEFVTEFCRFYLQVVLAPDVATESRHEYLVEVRASAASGGLKLIEGPVRDWMGFAKPQGISGGRDGFQVGTEEPGRDPLATAFSLLQQVYREFGYGDEAIPYTSGDAVEPGQFGK